MIDKIIPQKLDSSTDLKLTQKNSMVDALNVLITESEFVGSSNTDGDGSGDVGVLKNPLGTQSAQYVNEWDRINVNDHSTKVIGSVVDNKTKVVYFFVWSSSQDEHGVYAYDTYGVLPDGAPNTIRLIYKSGLFKFTQNGFVKADVVHVNQKTLDVFEGGDEFSTDALIYFTDNKNEPRKVNAYRCMLSNYLDATSFTTDSNVGLISSYFVSEKRKLISACTAVPLEVIEASFTNDPNYPGSNFKNTAGLQFAYQFVYRDGNESAISPYSAIVAPPVMLEQGSSTIVNYDQNNVCELHIPDWDREVKGIKILAREGENSSFLLVDEFPVDENTNNWTSSSQKYWFYNDKVLVGVSQEDVDKTFDAVPKAAQAQTVEENRLLYGNYVEGFSNVKATANILPKYKERDDSVLTQVKVIPTVSSGIVATPTSEHPITSGFILDFRDIELLEEGDQVQFNLSVAPDKNFHVARSSQIPTVNKRMNAYQYENQFDPYYTVVAYNNIASSTTAKNQARSIWGPNKMTVPAGQTIQYKRYASPNGSFSTQSFSDPTIGSTLFSPLVIKGGTLTFSVEFTHTGATKANDDARTFLSNVITDALTGASLTGYSDDIDTDSLIVNDTYIHSYDLGLENFDTISVGYPNIGLRQGQSAESSLYPQSAEPDYRANLVCPIGTSGAYNNIYDAGDLPGLMNGPMGYFIMNKVKAKFKLSEIESLNPVNDHIKEIRLNLDKLYDIETATCIRRPSILSPWVVLTDDFWDSQPNSQELFNAFINSSSVTLPSTLPANTDDFSKFFHIGEYDWTGATPAIEGNLFDNFGDGIFNYKSQFGRLIIGGNELDTDNLVIYDGEAGPGGYNGTDAYNAAQISKCGTVPFWAGFVDDADKVEYSSGTPTFYFFAGGPFLTGLRSMTGLNVEDDTLARLVGTSTGVENQLSQAPMYKGDTLLAGFGASSPASALFFNQNQYNTDLQHPEIEVINFYFNSAPFANNYKSFKSMSNHEFGVVYFDKFGRHGFVNPLGSIYVSGYSDQERTGEGKGRSYIQVQMTSNPPSWANKWKLVHSKSTSVEKFIQYTAGGAYVRAGDAELTNERNIYVSLNYLQGSNVSYVSSFGARTPEGGLNMYTYQKGDRLRVISYYNADGSIVYPFKHDFEVVDVVKLGDAQNPLFEADSSADYWLQGDFIVLKNNYNYPGFDYVSVKNGGDYWGNNCIVEIYRPSKNVDGNKLFYYEIGDTFSVIPPQALDVDSPLNRHGGTQTINDGDVWWRRVAVNFREEENGSFVDLLVNTLDDSGSNTSKSNFKDYWLETETSTDLIRGNAVGTGRVHTIYKDAEEVRRMSSITYSLPTNPLSKKNLYGSFNNTTLNFKDLPEKYGFINYMLNRGDSIIVIQDDKVSSVPINRNIIEQASGENLVVSSKDVLGKARFYSGIAGTDGHPESVVEVEESVYFVHASSGRVYRFTESSGLVDITNKGMLSRIREALNLAASSQGSLDDVSVVSGYDPLNEEYLLTIKSGTNIATGVFFDQEEFDTNFTTGCTEPLACNYDPDAQLNDGTCTYPQAFYNCEGNCINDSDGDGVCDELEVSGCSDPAAENYNANATDEGECFYSGCTDPVACNYDPEAVANDGSCEYLSCAGCLDPEADNYDPDATIPLNATCIYLGCTDPTACNYDPDANTDNGSCTYPETYYDCDGNCLNDSDGDGVCDELEKPGCTDPDACNYDIQATDEDGSCTYPELYYDCFGNCINDADGDGICDELEVPGCTNSVATNYDPLATNNDGSCELDVVGCHQPQACNYYGPLPTVPGLQINAIDDGSCVYASGACDVCENGAVVTYDADGDGVCDNDEIFGCTDSFACNYNPEATENDNNCDYVTCAGCIDPLACNYDPEALIGDDSCLFPVDIYGFDYYDCDGNCLNDSDGDGVCDEAEIPGCTNASACNFNSFATEDDGSCVFPSECIICFEGYTAPDPACCNEAPNITNISQYIEAYGLTYLDVIYTYVYLNGARHPNQEQRYINNLLKLYDSTNDYNVGIPDLLDLLSAFETDVIDLSDPATLQSELKRYIVEPSNPDCPVEYSTEACMKNYFYAFIEGCPANFCSSYQMHTRSYLTDVIGGLYAFNGASFTSTCQYYLSHMLKTLSGNVYTNELAGQYAEEILLHEYNYGIKKPYHLIEYLIEWEVPSYDIISQILRYDFKTLVFSLSLSELSDYVSIDPFIKINTTNLLSFLSQLNAPIDSSEDGFVFEQCNFNP